MLMHAMEMIWLAIMWDWKNKILECCLEFERFDWTL